MAVITISRGIMSGGEELANCLSKRIGYPAISREIIAETASKNGISETLLLQQLTKAPGIIERLTGEKRIYLSAIQTILAERALQENFIYHGNGGHFLLKGLQGVLKVRIVAPMNYRIKKVIEKKNLTFKEAENYIKNIDRQRTEWTKFLYEADWHDPALYDLVINIEDLSIAMACEIIIHTINLPEFQDTSERKKEREDFYLASLVKSKLTLSEKTRGMDINVKASGGRIVLSGKFYTSGPFPRGVHRTQNDILEVVQTVPGIKDIKIGIEALGIPVE
jgi:Cytidylate kinase